MSTNGRVASTAARNSKLKIKNSKVFNHKGFKLFEWVLYLRSRPLVGWANSDNLII